MSTYLSRRRMTNAPLSPYGPFSSRAHCYDVYLTHDETLNSITRKTGLLGENSNWLNYEKSESFLWRLCSERALLDLLDLYTVCHLTL